MFEVCAICGKEEEDAEKGEFVGLRPATHSLDDGLIGWSVDHGFLAHIYVFITITDT